MKISLKNVAAAFALIVILFAGCKNPAEDVEIIINTDIFKSPTLIQFVNAKKGAAGPNDFVVTITGPNADLVRTTTGGKSFKVTNGLLNLLLDRTANPSPASPVKFTIVANAAGFAPVFQDVIITSATDPNLYRVAVTDYANPALGSAAIIDTKAINNGTTSSDITITTATNIGVAQKTSITVPTGTSFLDAAGQPAGGGQLESRVVFASTATNGMTPVAPGGNVGRNVVRANGQTITTGVRFHPAGSVTIDMFAGAKEVRSFTKPVIIDMEVNSNMINPTTKQQVKEGETIPMWSLNDETGQWRAEGNATFIKNTSGKLSARMAVNHLCTWMSAWDDTPTCTTTVIIKKPVTEYGESFIINGLPTYYQENRVYLEPNETTKTITFTTDQYSSGMIWVYPNPTPYGGNAYVNDYLTSPFIDDFCGQTTTFTFVSPPAAELIDADVYVKAKCSGQSIATGINAIITISPETSPSDESRQYNLANGHGSGQVISGVSYRMSTSIDGQYYSGQFSASKTNFAIVSSGLDFAGTAVYNSIKNKLEIEITVTKRDCN